MWKNRNCPGNKLIASYAAEKVSKFGSTWKVRQYSSVEEVIKVVIADEAVRFSYIPLGTGIDKNWNKDAFPDSITECLRFTGKKTLRSIPWDIKTSAKYAEIQLRFRYRKIGDAGNAVPGSYERGIVPKPLNKY